MDKFLTLMLTLMHYIRSMHVDVAIYGKRSLQHNQVIAHLNQKVNSQTLKTNEAQKILKAMRFLSSRPYIKF